jgi:hypothetical protein
VSALTFEDFLEGSLRPGCWIALCLVRHASVGHSVSVELRVPNHSAFEFRDLPKPVCRFLVSSGLDQDFGQLKLWKAKAVPLFVCCLACQHQVSLSLREFANSPVGPAKKFVREREFEKVVIVGHDPLE